MLKFTPRSLRSIIQFEMRSRRGQRANHERILHFQGKKTFFWPSNHQPSDFSHQTPKPDVFRHLLVTKVILPIYVCVRFKKIIKS